jgi:signal peptidase I
VGDPLVLSPGRSSGVAATRFGVGLTGLFLCTVVATLGLLATLAALLPQFDSTAVSSGSMQPTIRRGDVVLYRHVDGGDRIGEGTVVVFTGDTGASTVHRVVAVNADSSLTTRGDANAENDSASVAMSAVSGTGSLLVPWVGLPSVWWRESRFVLVAVAGVVLGLAAFVSRWASESVYDPWRHGVRTSPSESWLGRPSPAVPGRLVDEEIRSLIVDRARACR